MISQSGLQETGQGAKQIEAVLQQMFPASSPNEKVDKMKALTEAYHNYKMGFVKHLSFNPEGGNLSKFISYDIFMIGFSNRVGTCPIGGSVHIL